MFNPDDTIVAIATPPGRGGIGVVRVSGPASGEIAAALSGRTEPLEARRATVLRVRAGGAAIDRAVLTFFPTPQSYTGEDVLEISAHGSPVLLRAIVGAAMAAGARLAEPGEFTFRAYLRGRIDLVQAEAVQDLVEAVTPLQARAAFDQLEGTLTTRIREIDGALFDLSARLEASLDFPDEGYHFVEADSAAREILGVVASIDALLTDAARGRLVREGAQIAIIGRPNAGKSSLFNRLAGAGRAIVTDIPGTTRDLLTESSDIEGVPVTLVDTAGLHKTAADAVEEEGIARAHAARRVADLTIVVLDGSRPLGPDDHDVLAISASAPRVVVANKADLPPAWRLDAAGDGVRVMSVSAKTGAGIDALRVAISSELAARDAVRDTPAVTNIRHADLLSRARAALQRAAAAAACGTPEEFVAADVNEARALLEEVTGARTPDDVLHAIFDKFCIGK
jgi:tRNA modification GTPase